MSRHAALLLALLALSASAQERPGVPKTPGKPFFSQDAAVLIPASADEARRLEPKDRQLKVEYGEVQLALGNRSAAEADFAEALKGAEDDPRVHHWIGQAWLRRRFVKEALASYDAMVKVTLQARFETRKSLFANAAVDLVAAEPEAAARYMEEAYKLGRRDADNCLAFAKAALRSGQRDLAALYFSRAIQADPRDPDVWLEVSNAFADYQVAHRPR